MQISKILNALHPFISFLPAPAAEQGQCKTSCALREHFQRSEECNGSTKEVHISSDNEVSQLRSPVQYDTDAFFSGTNQ